VYKRQRYAKLPTIMKAKRKPVAVKALADVGLSADDIAPAVVSTNFGLPPERSSGRKLDGDVDAMVSQLVDLLRNEAKVL